MRHTKLRVSYKDYCFSHRFCSGIGSLPFGFENAMLRPQSGHFTSPTNILGRPVLLGRFFTLINFCTSSKVSSSTIASWVFRTMIHSSLGTDTSFLFLNDFVCVLWDTMWPRYTWFSKIIFTFFPTQSVGNLNPCLCPMYRSSLPGMPAGLRFHPRIEPLQSDVRCCPASIIQKYAWR